MNKERPVNLDISTIKLPVTALVSITHRISGVIMLAGILLLIYMLDMSLSSAQGFESLKATLTEPWAKFLVWGVLSALAYHMVMGVRHLIMDLGFGETLQGGKLGAQIALGVAIVLIVILGVWVW